MGIIHLLSPKGFQAGAVAAQIKASGKIDVGLLVCDTLAPAAAVFTTNKVFAAPIAIGRDHISRGKLRAIVVNSGNANACTGKQGYRDGLRMCQLAADGIRCDAGEVLPSSTGIIGHHLPMEKVEKGIAGAAADLGSDEEHALRFADAILTTDLKRKSAGVEFKIGRQVVRLAGVCKGSGMIGPRMSLAGPDPGASKSGKKQRPLHATMLAYLTTDADISPALLRRLMGPAADASFNAVTVDDHTSTNDTAVILASGASGAKVNSPRATQAFRSALDEVCQSLAYQIAADGEGATKVVHVTVKGADSLAAARAMARVIANSPLVKCAMHGNDPNWGRIVSAAGLAGVPFDPDRATLTLQGTVVFKNGQPAPFDAEALSAKLKVPDVQVVLACKLGKFDATVWTCDLSKEYVTINADYHT